MTGGAQSDPSGPPPGSDPPGDRVWQHPSEVGLAARGRNDRRRAALLAAGVVISGIGILVSGVLMGAVQRDDGTTTTTTPMDRVARSVAHVTAEHAGSTATMLTGVVLDDQGHVLVPADAVLDADKVWVRCDSGSDEQAEVLGVDASTDLAVLRVTHASGWPATTVDTPPRAGAEVVTVHAKGGMDLAMRSGTVAPAAVLTGTTLVGSLPAMQAEVRDEPDDGTPAATGLTGGLVFDRSGRFLGMTTAVDAEGSDADTSLVDVMPADAALAAAARIIDGD